MKNKIYAVSAIIAIIGIIIVAVFGYNVDYSYKNNMLFTLEIGQEFDLKDIKNITNDVFGKQKVESHISGTYSDILVIKANEISDEQKASLVNKINEKYGTEKQLEDATVDYIPSFKLTDLVKEYIMPLIIATLITLVYMVVRFGKIGLPKVFFESVLYSLIALVLYASIIAITRFPVNRFVMPGAIIIYMAVFMFLANGYEKQLSKEGKTE